MGGVDVVLDDGSHVALHQRVSFDTLFPLLSANGLYVVEDTHTAYFFDFAEASGGAAPSSRWPRAWWMGSTSGTSEHRWAAEPRWHGETSSRSSFSTPLFRVEKDPAVDLKFG